MVRYTPDDFLNEYKRYLQFCNDNKKGAVELTMKRYDAADEAKLNPSCNKTGSIRPVPAKAAANPETTKNNKKNTKNAQPAKLITKKIVTSHPDNVEILQEPSLLIRAKFGDKKASTVVKNSEFEKFNHQFRTLFRLYSAKFLVPEDGISNNLKKRKIIAKKSPSTPAKK